MVNKPHELTRLTLNGRLLRAFGIIATANLVSINYRYFVDTINERISEQIQLNKQLMLWNLLARAIYRIMREFVPLHCV